jgi:hypothetical protein
MEVSFVHNRMLVVYYLRMCSYITSKYSACMYIVTITASQAVRIVYIGLFCNWVTEASATEGQTWTSAVLAVGNKLTPVTLPLVLFFDCKAMTASADDLARFIARQKQLLAQERKAEIERTSLLLSKCSQKTLEQNGLALGGLGVASMSIGLGGKTYMQISY